MMKGTFSVPSWTRTVYPAMERGGSLRKRHRCTLTLDRPGSWWLSVGRVAGQGQESGRGARDRQGMRLKKGGRPRHTGSGASGAERKPEPSVT